MNGPTITVMPALFDPEKLSKAELIEKCKEQQQTMILQDKAIQSAVSKLADTCRNAFDLAAQLHDLVDFFDANNQSMIYVRLKTMSDQRKSYIKPRVD